jgi:hypothetical protein
MQQTSFYAEDGEQRYQRARIESWTWEASAVFERTGTTAELYRNIPVFTRHPYRSGGEENRYKDEIRREPLELTETQIPIATVSKTYALVQHRDVISSVFRALQLVQKDLSNTQASLVVSEYDERIHWSCQLPGFDFDPGDKNPIVLRINCLNSVDTTTALEISLSWFRLVCSNGMMFGLQGSRLKKRHIHSLDPDDIVSYLQGEFKEATGEVGLYQSWFEATIKLDRVTEWIDSHVARIWGPHAACRIWHIITQGNDGEVEVKHEKNLLPHNLPLRELIPVPGTAIPGGNLFYLSQALSWYAGTRNSVQEQLELIKEIPSLMSPLTEV